MTIETFGAEPGVRDFILWLVREVGGADLRGWTDALASYRWAGFGLDLTLECRRRQGAALAAAGSAKEWSAACEHVREWSGAQPPFDRQDLARLRAGRDLLDSETVESLEALQLVRVPTSSKVFAAIFPERWVVYDSRVARRLAEFVRKWWRREREESAEDVLRFPVPQPRGGVDVPPGFVSLGDRAVIQARLAFIYASWLCRMVAEELNRLRVPLPTVEVGEMLQLWTAQLVEMALFSLSA